MVTLPVSLIFNKGSGEKPGSKGLPDADKLTGTKSVSSHAPAVNVESLIKNLLFICFPDQDLLHHVLSTY